MYTCHRAVQPQQYSMTKSARTRRTVHAVDRSTGVTGTLDAPEPVTAAPQDDVNDAWRSLAPKRAHVVCATDDALISVDLEAYQPRASLALSAAPGCITANGGLVVAAASKDASVAGGHLGKNACTLSSRVPEKLGAVSITPDGLWLVGGGATSGRLYLWELWSGRLARCWEGHFRGVTALAIDERGDHLISGGGDGLVRPWCLQTAGDSERCRGARDAFAPLYDDWSDHALPVVALVVQGGRCWSVASDRSVHGRELCGGHQVFQASLSGAPSCLGVDALDSFLLVGTEEGPILRLDLDAWAHALTKREEPQLQQATYDGHAQKVVGIVAVNAETFVSASVDGTLRVWDIAARREIRRIELAPGAPPVRALAWLPRVPAPPVAASLQRDADDAPGDVPCSVLRPLARVPEARSAGAAALRARADAARREARRWAAVAGALWDAAELEDA